MTSSRATEIAKRKASSSPLTFADDFRDRLLAMISAEARITFPSTRFRDDPVAFCREVLGFEPWAKQVEILEIPHAVETEQNARLAKMRASRSNDEVKRALTAIRDAARKGENVMPSLVAASLVRCTLGEQVQAMADVYGRYSGGPEW